MLAHFYKVASIKLPGSTLIDPIKNLAVAHRTLVPFETAAPETLSSEGVPMRDKRWTHCS